MRRQAYTVIALLVLVGSMAVAARAQTGSRTPLIANIPFEFNVGNKTLPAGEYLIRSANVVLKIQSRHGKSGAMVQMMQVEGKAQESAKLIFHRYGNDYFFAQAWVDGEKIGLEAQKSHSERAAEREYASLRMASESIVLAARR